MVAKERVLIVEDDNIVQMHLGTIVRELGYEVCGTASTADEALRSAAANDPQLVLMDIRLSGSRDGIEAARELRLQRDIAVIFMTAYADEETVQRAQEIGALGYVVKPFSKPQLRAALSMALSELRRRQRMGASKSAEDEVDGVRLAPPRMGTERVPFGAGTRMAMYSHDTLGLGHLQRSLNIARTLTARFPGLSILLLSGSPAAHRYALPQGVDYIKLPAVRKVGSERYEARSLGMSDEGVLRLRSNIVLRSLQDYDPHLLLVDHAPVGMKGELRPALAWLHANRPDCTKMLGLRDVLDEPEAVIAQWQKHGIYDVLRDYYQHVLIYGQADVFDLARAYRMPPELHAKVRYVNYVGEFDEATELRSAAPASCTEKPLVVVTVGGGDGGEPVIDLYLDMLHAGGPHVGYDTILLTGPLVAPDALKRFRERARGLPVAVLDFVPSSSPFLERADLVVCSGGYNTVVQTLRFGKRMILIPRVMYRSEQLIRARRLAELGLVTCLHPAQATAERLGEAIRSLLADPTLPLVEARARQRIRFDGAERLADLCAGLQVATSGVV